MIVGVACAGLSGWSYASEQLVPYALGALLWTNFALMPLTGMSVGQYKRLACTVVLTATFGTPILVAPLVSLFIPEGGPVALAAVIVLLAPCVDYVVVFTRIAGGEYRGLLAATPYLLGAQLIFIPVWTSIYAYIGILDTRVVGEIFPLPAESYLRLTPPLQPPHSLPPEGLFFFFFFKRNATCLPYLSCLSPFWVWHLLATLSTLIVNLSRKKFITFFTTTRPFKAGFYMNRLLGFHIGLKVIK